MSIDILIDHYLTNGTLFRLHPWLPSTRLTRMICLAPSVNEYVLSDEYRAGRLHQDLDLFIAGDIITVSMIPRKAGVAYMALLDPTEDAIWDMRSRDPSPGLRILGAFARKDYFIGLVLRTRRQLVNDKHWDKAIAECHREWRARFHALLPHSGVDENAYLTNCTCVDRDI